MGATWEEQVRELDKKFGNPDYYLIEKFEVLDDISLVDRAANRQEFVLVKAEWTAAFINDLPDSSFAVIEPGGKKDGEGKTVPRSLRHLPYKDTDGAVDLPHLRNALARLPQTQLSASLKTRVRRVLEAAAKQSKVGEYVNKEGGVTILSDEDIIAEVTEETLAEDPQDESLVRRIVKAAIPRLRKEAPSESPRAEAQKASSEETEVVKVLQTQLAESRKEIEALKERYAAAEKAAENARLEREVDDLIDKGGLLPRSKALLMAALRNESITVKSAEGVEKTLTPRDTILEFAKEVAKGVPLGEVSSSADKEDFGKFNGKSAGEYALEQMTLAGRKPAQ